MWQIATCMTRSCHAFYQTDHKCEEVCMSMQRDGVTFSILTHKTEVPRSPRSEESEGASSLQWRSLGNETNKKLANVLRMQLLVLHCTADVLCCSRGERGWQNKGTTESNKVCSLVSNTLRVPWRPRSAEHTTYFLWSCLWVILGITESRVLRKIKEN